DRGVSPVTRALAFSPDGKMLVGADFNRILLWDAATGAKKADLLVKGRGGDVSSFSFSADGRWLPAGFNYGQQIVPVVWDLSNLTETGPFPVIHTDRVSAVLSADGKLLATWGIQRGGGGGLQQVVQLWDVDARKELRQIKVEASQVTAAAF